MGKRLFESFSHLCVKSTGQDEDGRHQREEAAVVFVVVDRVDVDAEFAVAAVDVLGDRDARIQES